MGGIFVGLLIRSPLFAQMTRLYDDAELWEVAGEEGAVVPVNRSQDDVPMRPLKQRVSGNKVYPMDV